MVERRLVAIGGVVQGVGFRPYLQSLATTHNLRGQVWNDRDGLRADLEGSARRSIASSPPCAQLRPLTR